MKKMVQFSQWISRTIRPIYVLAFTLIFMAFIVWVLPSVSEATRLATGTSEGPDTAFFYTASSLYELAGLYGQGGRNYYIANRFTFDLVWPLAYGLFLTSALALLFKKWPSPRAWVGTRMGTRLGLLNLLPLAGVAFDYLENISASYAMYVYPATTPLAALATYFTALKWTCIYSSFGLVLVGVPVLLVIKLVMNLKRP